MLPKFLGIAGLALAPLLSLAQAPPRLYTGVGASLLSSTPFQSYSTKISTKIVGPTGVVGLQLSPRWALQSGAFVRWRNSSYSKNLTTGSGTLENYSFSEHSTSVSIPLLARYTFTAPTARLHVDALFGATWLHSSYRGTSSYSTYGSPITTHNFNSSYNGASLAVGPSVRYTLGSSLDIVASSLVQGEISGGGSFSDRLFLATQLGVQYTFGQQ
jgi:hypothetical protein